MTSGSVWVTGDIISSTRMNQKTNLIDTGANLNSATKAAGMLMYCTFTGSGYIIDHAYQVKADGSTIVDVTTNINNANVIVSDVEVYPYSTTIGDFTAITQGTAIMYNNSGASLTDEDNLGNVANEFDCAGQVLGASSAMIGKIVGKIVVLLKKSGSPAGTIFGKVFDAAGVEQESFGSLSASSLTTSYASYTLINATPNGYILASGDRIVVYYGATASSNYVVIGRSTDTIANTNTCVRNGSATWSSVTTRDDIMDIYSFLEYDWTSLAEMAEVAFSYTPGSTTATQFKIQTSPDMTVWTDKRLINVSDLGGSLNYYRWNRDIAQNRYVRFHPISGVITISAVNAIAPSETLWNRRHGHKFIDPTNATLGATS